MDREPQFPQQFAIANTIIGTAEWVELVKKEDLIGTEALLEEITAKHLWSNAEILWILKHMLYFYGKPDTVLKKIPPNRIFANMTDILRTFYLLMDWYDPPIDDNMRSYICQKLTDATWGINHRTRKYLEKFDNNK